MTKASVIRVEKIDGVGVITLNRPDFGNALSLELCQDLLLAVKSYEADDTVRSVLLTGSGRFFCVGGDVKTFVGEVDMVAKLMTAITDNLHKAQSILLRMEKPLVVAVNGAAAGAGLGLAAAGDLVFAAESAHFTMAYTGIGFSPDGGTSWLLPRLVGLRRAQEMALTNRRISSQEAVEYGLITRSIADEDLAAEAIDAARNLANGPTKAFSSVRALLQSSYAATPEAQMTDEATRVCAQAVGPEGREGVAAFSEKRKPAFH